MLIRRRKEEQIEYKTEFFYLMNSWWKFERDGRFTYCFRVNLSDVTKEYL